MQLGEFIPSMAPTPFCSFSGFLLAIFLSQLLFLPVSLEEGTGHLMILSLSGPHSLPPVPIISQQILVSIML
jgi:hypothetical protein